MEGCGIDIPRTESGGVVSLRMFKSTGREIYMSSSAFWMALKGRAGSISKFSGWPNMSSNPMEESAPDINTIARTREKESKISEMRFDL